MSMRLRLVRQVALNESSFLHIKPAMLRRFFIVIILVTGVMTMDAITQDQTRTVIFGRVTDVETGEPLENVNVFVAFTTIGTTTDSRGNFELKNVPFGVFTLVTSRVGYEQQVNSLQVFQHDSLYYEIRLKPYILEMQSMEITAKKDKEWEENLERFVKVFIGEVDNSEDCIIVNPEVLNFGFFNDTLFCGSNNILLIDNKFLGYRLHIVLRDFVWNTRTDAGYYLIYPSFEPLEAHDSDVISEWKSNRKKAYNGSIKHFLRSLYFGNAEQEMFTIFSGPLKKLAMGGGHRVYSSEFNLEQQPGLPFKTLSFTGYLRVEYGRRSEESYIIQDKYRRARERLVWVDDLKSISIISLKNSYAIIDSLGNLLNPLSLEVSGGWAKSRIANLLPLY